MQSNVQIPQGEKIQIAANGSLQVPNNPIIPFIEGDGIGVDVTPAMQVVIDAAVEKAYQGKRTQVVKRMKFMVKILGYLLKRSILFVNIMLQLKDH